ncbi:MAG: hypothetical protein IJS89_03350 [Bacteroidaceae bacterium]|nr:hypothetical protein [Bacteroidaceae bacterium]
MIDVAISPELRCAAPHYRGAFIEAQVENMPTSPELWQEISTICDWLREEYDTTSLKERPGIRATRAAYRAAGKDPSRYRPACEQLCRRVLQGKALYSISTLVDVGNAISMRSGYMVGVLDRDKIVGNRLSLGIGRPEEAYEGIGRGPLNIAFMPVFRDEVGAVATPTSDHVRTQCGPDTKHVLVIINGYDGNEASLHDAADYARGLLERFAQAQDVVWQMV